MSRILFTSLLLSGLLFWGAAMLPAQSINPEDVTIVRDQWGTPHIYGKTDADAAYGLAWATCEDNFEDIQSNLALSRGRLGEILGAQGAAADFAWNLFRIQDLVDAQYPSELSAEFQQVLTAYVQGVNDFAESHPKEIILKKSFPLSEKDILAGYAMSMCLMTGVDAHLVNILEGRPGGTTSHSLRGSNGFALNSNKTDNGEVFLANNSHQPLEGQMSWYEVHINSEEGLNALGGLFPSGVSVFAGCNEHLAWMHTVNYQDFTDDFELKMHPKKKLMYRFDGKWEKLEVRKAKLKAKIGPLKIPVSKKVYWSKYGPTLKGKKGADGFYSIRFGAMETIKAAEQWWRMNKTKNFTEFRRVLDMQGISGMNIIYADKNDTIYYLDNGLIPRRPAGYNWRGLLPGDTSLTLVEEYQPVSELVQSLNPECGYVYNTNHSPLYSSSPDCFLRAEDFDSTIGFSQIDNNRSIHFRNLMDAQDKVSYERFVEIKYDSHFPKPMYVFFLENAEDIFNLDPNEFPDFGAPIRMLKEWDRGSGADNVGASLFLLTYREAYRRIKEKNQQHLRMSYPPEFYIECIEEAQEYLLKHFGTLQVPLGELQRHVRGDKDWPLGGLPDVLPAMYSQKWKKGKLKGWLGDSYIQLIRFTPEGIKIETCMPFGASNRPESPHYDDQVEMYLSHTRKEMTLDKKAVFEHAARIYHPGDKP